MSRDTVEVSVKIALAFDISARFQKKVLVKHYGKEKTDVWLKRARDMFRSIYPSMPDIGGKENFLYQSLLFSTFLMPTAVILKDEGLSTREIGEFLFRLAERVYAAVPFPFRLSKRRSYFKERNIEKYRLAAERSRLRRYPADWVFDFVEGEEKYLFGYDFRECAIHKFWSSRGLEELVPYLCLTDWASWKSIGMGVDRTKTIGNGHEVCDFRFCRQEKVCRSGWPPESNPEWTGRFEITKGK
jgi:hypothetical protein